MVRALNYHGQPLTNFLKDQPLFRHLDLKSVDYHLYHKRSRELRMEDRGRRLILHQFISQNMESLFRRQEVSLTSNSVQASCCTDDFLPPMETFLSKRLSKEERTKYFFDLAQEGDLLYCSVEGKKPYGLILTILCFAPETGKAQTLCDPGVKCVCPSDEIVPSDAGRVYVQESTFT